MTLYVTLYVLRGTYFVVRVTCNELVHACVHTHDYTHDHTHKPRRDCATFGMPDALLGRDVLPDGQQRVFAEFVWERERQREEFTKLVKEIQARELNAYERGFHELWERQTELINQAEMAMSTFITNDGSETAASGDTFATDPTGTRPKCLQDVVDTSQMFSG